MSVPSLIRFVCLVALFLAAQSQAATQNIFTGAEGNAIKAFLQENFGRTNAGMVVGLIDKHGSRIISAGKLDNGSSQEVNGDTLFVIGSVTKTFTVLLLQDMVARGQMKLDDPVAKYLPVSVRVPARNGKQITLLHLATHTSGLPFDADNIIQTNAPDGNPFSGYTIAKLYAFLSNHSLSRDPGADYGYSNIGSVLLGHAIERQAGMSYESLVIERICRPLGMDSTRITVTPDLKARLAVGHHASGEACPIWDLGAYAPAGALRSTPNDLLKYLSANVGLTASSLTPLMEKTHLIRHTNSQGAVEGGGNTAMAWMDFGVYQPPGTQFLGHGGGNGGFSAFVGFDKKQQRGVVVLSNQRAGSANTYNVGWRILQRAPLAGFNLHTMQPVREIVGSGIGLAVHPETRLLRIIQVISNTPAARAGLSVGLTVQKINDIPTTGKSVSECIGLMAGPIGTKVRLEVLDPEKNETSAVELTKEKFMIWN